MLFFKKNPELPSCHQDAPVSQPEHKEGASSAWNRARSGFAPSWHARPMESVRCWTRPGISTSWWAACASLPHVCGGTWASLGECGKGPQILQGADQLPWGAHICLTHSLSRGHGGVGMRVASGSVWGIGSALAVMEVFFSCPVRYSSHLEMWLVWLRHWILNCTSITTCGYWLLHRTVQL